MMVRSPHHLSAPLPLKASHLIFPQHSPPPPADPLPSLLADSPSPLPLLAKAERVGNYLLNALTYLRPAPCYSLLGVCVSVKQNVKLRIHWRRNDPPFFIDLATNVIYELVQPECTYHFSLHHPPQLTWNWIKGDKKLKAHETRLKQLRHRRGVRR